MAEVIRLREEGQVATRRDWPEQFGGLKSGPVRESGGVSQGFDCNSPENWLISTYLGFRRGMRMESRHG